MLYTNSQILGANPDLTDINGGDIQNKDILFLLSSCNAHELN